MADPHRMVWDETTMARVEQMYLQGVDLEVIAARMGCSNTAVRSLLKRKGLRRPDKKMFYTRGEKQNEKDRAQMLDAVVVEGHNLCGIKLPECWK